MSANARRLLNHKRRRPSRHNKRKRIMEETRTAKEQRADVIALMVKENDMSFSEAEAKFDSSAFANGAGQANKPALEDQKLYDIIRANGHSQARAIEDVNFCRRSRGVTEPFIPAKSAA